MSKTDGYVANIGDLRSAASDLGSVRFASACLSEYLGKIW